jgi:hypothetical protein
MKLSTVRAAVLAPLLALVIMPTAALATSPVNQTAVNNGLAYLSSQQSAAGDIAGSASINAWSAMAYSAAGTNNQSLLSYLEANPPDAGADAIVWERDILAITASHQNPYDFGGANYVAGLAAKHPNDFLAVSAQLSARTPKTDPDLTGALAFILAHQNADGGFGSPASDTEDTAIAVMSLVAAQKAGLTVAATIISSAKDYLLGTQNQNGGFPYSSGQSNVTSTSFVLMSLTALGVGGSGHASDAAGYLRGRQRQNGSFPHQAGPGNTSDTAFALIALADGSLPLDVYDGRVPGVTTDPASGSVLGASTTAGSGAGAASGPVLPVVGGGIPTPVAGGLVLVAMGALWHLSRQPKVRRPRS